MGNRVYIRHIFISSGHNFVGHHGKPPGEYAAHEVNSIHCVAGKGLVGDRYFGFKEPFKGQATLFDWSVFQNLQSTFPSASFPLQPCAGTS